MTEIIGVTLLAIGIASVFPMLESEHEKRIREMDEQRETLNNEADADESVEI